MDVEKAASYLKSLSHKKRLEIVLALKDGPKTFSEIMKMSNIKSGSELTFHLGKLIGIVEKGSDGRYRLTGRGLMLIKLLDDIEGSNGLVDPPESKEIPLLITINIILASISLILTCYGLYRGYDLPIIAHALTSIAILATSTTIIIYLKRYSIINNYPYLIRMPAFLYKVSKLPREMRTGFIDRIFGINLLVGLMINLYTLSFILHLFLLHPKPSLQLISTIIFLGIPVVVFYSYRRINKELDIEINSLYS